MTKRGRYIAVVVLSLVVAAVQTRVFWGSDDGAVASAGWLLDDAFFYGVIAERLVESGRLEFYPGMKTNGFQPLWLGVVAGAHWLVSTISALEWIRYLGVGAYLLFAGLSLGLVYRMTERSVIPAAALSVFVLLQPGFQQWVLNGMETALTLVVFVAAIWQTARIDWESRRPSRWALAGLAVVSALCFFARTDLFVVGLVLTVWVWWRYGVGPEAVIFAGVLGALVTPYLGANLVFFDALVPVSGSAKQFYFETFYPTLGAYLGSDQWRGLFDALAVLAPWEATRFGEPVSTVLTVLTATTGMLPVVAGYAAFRDVEILGDTGAGRALRIFAAAAGLHLVVMYGYLRTVRPHDSYYFAPTVVLIALILTVGGYRTFRRFCDGWSPQRRRLVQIIVAVVVVGWGLMAAAGTAEALRGDESGDWGQRVALAEELETELAETATVGAYWPGALAYFSDLEVMPLDGIIASPGYQREVMREREALTYLCSFSEPHLAVYLPVEIRELRSMPERPEVRDWSWAHIHEIWAHEGRFEVVSRRDTDEGAPGWYLLEVTCDEDPGVEDFRNVEADG